MFFVGFFSAMGMRGGVETDPQTIALVCLIILLCGKFSGNIIPKWIVKAKQQHQQQENLYD